VSYFCKKIGLCSFNVLTHWVLFGTDWMTNCPEKAIHFLATNVARFLHARCSTTVLEEPYLSWPQTWRPFCMPGVPQLSWKSHAFLGHRRGAFFACQVPHNCPRKVAEYLSAAGLRLCLPRQPISPRWLGLRV
jgi:hypothetical protein